MTRYYAEYFDLHFYLNAVDHFGTSACFARCSSTLTYLAVQILNSTCLESLKSLDYECSEDSASLGLHLQALTLREEECYLNFNCEKATN